MVIKPTGNRILVEIDELPQSFAGGELVIARVPDHDGYYKLFPRRGIVRATGPKVNDVEVGDGVIMTKYHGVELDGRRLGLGDGKFLLVKEDFVILRAPASEIPFAERQLVEYCDEALKKR